jgi:hypothetical protein
VYAFGGIDLDTLLLVLQEFQYSGQIRGTLQTNETMAGPLQVTLVLADGKLAESRLVANDGTRFEGKDAFRLAHAYQPFEWQLLPDDYGYAARTSSPQFTQHVPPSPPSGEWSLLQPSTIARRVESVSIDERTLQTWEIRQRMVYRLMNGKRDMETIRKIVFLSPEAMEQIIAALLAKRVITISS